MKDRRAGNCPSERRDEPVKRVFQFGEIFVKSRQFFFHLGTSQHGAELIKQHHPRPGPHREERPEVELDHLHGIPGDDGQTFSAARRRRCSAHPLQRSCPRALFIPLQHHLVPFQPHQPPPGHGLNDGEDLGQAGVSHVFQDTQQSRLEKHLRRRTGAHTRPPSLVPTSFSTLVCPNLYWLWSMSSEPSNFSTAFLLSTNEPSGIAEEFRMRYLEERRQQRVSDGSGSPGFGPAWLQVFGPTAV